MLFQRVIPMHLRRYLRKKPPDARHRGAVVLSVMTVCAGQLLNIHNCQTVGGNALYALTGSLVNDDAAATQVVCGYIGAGL